MKRITLMMILGTCMAISGEIYDALDYLESKGLSKKTRAEMTSAVEELAARLQPGDVLGLPRNTRLDTLDFSALSDGVQIEFGTADAIYLGPGRKEGLVFLDVDAPLITTLEGIAKRTAGSTVLENCTFNNTRGNLAANFVNARFVHYTGTIHADEFVNCAGFWIRYMGGQNAIYLNNVGDCKGSRLYQIVEHNYCVGNASVRINGAKNLFIGVGDTEGATSPEGCWTLNNCEDVVLFAHRMFHSHDTRCGIECGKSYTVNGGNNVQFYYAQCIGNPCDTSLAVNSDNFKIFGGSWEDKVGVEGANPFYLFHTPEALATEFNMWTEPVIVDKEVILSNGPYRIDGTDRDVSSPPEDITFPVPPSLPSMGLGSIPESVLGKESRSWGRDLVSAGADPTGRRSSSAAFQLMMHRGLDVLEIPRGTFLLDRPIIIDGDANPRAVVGAGPGLTELRAMGDFPVIVVDTRKGLAKGDGAMKITENYINQTFTGPIGIEVRHYGSLTPAGIVRSCTFQCSDYGVYAKSGVEFDQVFFQDCKFEGGNYGVYYGNNMVDKQGFFECLFSQQNKAGVAAPNSHMFAGSFTTCRFENINGPGIEMGHDPASGYTPHQSMVNECVFIDCGSETEPSLYWGWMESSALIDVRVEINSKTVPFGILGTGQIMDRCSVFVNGGHLSRGAFGVLHTRMAKNSRPTGNVLRECWSNSGGITFVTDVPSAVVLSPTAEGRTAGRYYGNPPVHSSNPEKVELPWGGDLKWWQHEDPSTKYPWAYPHLLYHCTFGDDTRFKDYVLLRTNRNGEILQMIGLNGTEVSVMPKKIGMQRSQTRRNTTYYTLRGRKIEKTGIRPYNALSAGGVVIAVDGGIPVGKLELSGK